MGGLGNNWHKVLGSVLVIRQDKKPLTPHHVEASVMFCESKASVMADDDNPNHALLNFILEYDEQKQDEARLEIEAESGWKEKLTLT
ncbi:hypothetical protein OCU04_011939 [Sclerotinia nivalis]|uniref:Uncharacterized protein n=1 Tax=Sclerotinia nivalis TaxID=352851 RepID=A0A9X0A9X5_9HELO|nr:hypothetical protein OCU04_011939 [Sclerotinia nivalis]